MRIDFLESVRGVAILAVLAYHIAGAAYGTDRLGWDGILPDFESRPAVLFPLSFGCYGVAVFFVLSGFLIHHTFTGSWRAYVGRRFWRIYPPYLVALAGFVVLSRTSDVWQILSHALLIHNFTGSTLFGICPAFWSIAVECQLYALYPLILAASVRFGWRHTLAVCAASEVLSRLAWGAALTADRWIPPFLLGSPTTYLFSWSIGAALADAYQNQNRLRLPSFWLLAGLGVACQSIRPLFPLAFTMAALATASALQHFLTHPPSVSCPPLRWLGLISYSVYLLHQPLLQWPLVAALAPVLFFTLIERPSHHLGRRLTRTGTRRSASSSVRRSA